MKIDEIDECYFAATHKWPVHYKKDIGKFEARNPFNRGGRINGYIFEFKKTEFPDCIIK